jgi:hypothetical protein
MADLFLQIALALAGGVASALIAGWVTDLKSPAAIGIGIGISLCWIAIAVVVRARGDTKPHPATEPKLQVGTEIKAKGGVNIKGINSNEPSATIGKNISSERDVNIQDVKIKH